jgi:hypothetical protein
MNCMAKAILVVGLAAVSVYAHLSSGGVIGAGWAILAVLCLFFASCDKG